MRIVWSLDRSSDIGRALLAATRRLREADIDSAQLDAAVLLCSVLGVNKAWLYAHPTRQLTEHEIAKYEELVRRRMCHEPVAYLVGYKPFYGLDITVDNRVLIPRPETEMLVERALLHLRHLLEDGQRPVIADIGTGSGAIAVAIAVNAPEATVYATDVSAACMEVCEKNIWRYGVGEQVHLAPGSLIDNLPEPVDIVVANLPYVATPDLATLPPQVREYEPVLALDGGPDGAAVIRKLLAAFASPAGRAKLKPGAVIFLEIGADQGALVRSAVDEVLPQCGCNVLVDYTGLDRVVVITT
ncbi:MAG: peptide chain release factor N(5)-glutamine methyltransferase [Anaerolineae bacterium]|nr:peptide chain release factor N(5)-glutamine methyltransferase [Anaerolineae bacterium]